MTSQPLAPRAPHDRPLLLAALAVPALLVVLTACSGSSSGGTGSAAGATGASSSAASGNRAPGAAAPAASGQVAAIDGTTMQVQNPQSGQVAVAWTATTSFTHTVTTTLAAVQVGQCVTALAPAGTSSSATSFTATTLMVSKPVGGDCGGRAGGAGGRRPSGAPSGGNRPSGFPTGGTRPSGFPRGGAGGSFGAFVSGKVTSVTGSTVVVAARTFASGSTATTSKTITTGAKTLVTTEATTTAASVKVGLCVTAQGKADSTGTVAAQAVRITQPVNGQCRAFGGAGQGNR